MQEKRKGYIYMKKILLIATGGTIASKYTVQGLSPQIQTLYIIISFLQAVCQTAV